MTTLHTLPLFPLQDLVLFPRTLLPLHIFESRYRKMVHRALATHRRIATASFKPGWEKQYFDSPKVYRTITIARILHEEQLEDGKFNILLEGIDRALLIEELEHEPYRVVKAESVTDVMSESDRHAIQEAQAEMVGLANELAERVPELSDGLSNLENLHLHPGIIADQIASAVVINGYEKQGILEERSVLRRINLVNVQMRAVLAKLKDRAG